DAPSRQPQPPARVQALDPDPPVVQRGDAVRRRREEGEEAARSLIVPFSSFFYFLQGVFRGTREAGGQRPQEASRRSRASQRLPRPALAVVPQGQGADAPLAQLRLPRPSGPQG